MIDGDECGRAPRHAGRKGIVGILHDGQPAGFFHRREARGPIVQRTGEDHADHARAIHTSGRSEQRVDRGAAAILGWTVDDPGLSRFNGEMVIGGRNIDAAVLEWIAVPRVHRGELTGPRQDFWQHAAPS